MKMKTSRVCLCIVVVVTKTQANVTTQQVFYRPMRCTSHSTPSVASNTNKEFENTITTGMGTRIGRQHTQCTHVSCFSEFVDAMCMEAVVCASQHHMNPNNTTTHKSFHSLHMPHTMVQPSSVASSFKQQSMPEEYNDRHDKLAATTPKHCTNTPYTCHQGRCGIWHTRRSSLGTEYTCRLNKLRKKDKCSHRTISKRPQCHDIPFSQLDSFV